MENINHYPIYDQTMEILNSPFFTCLKIVSIVEVNDSHFVYLLYKINITLLSRNFL